MADTNRALPPPLTLGHPCTVEGCGREFESEQGRNLHVSLAHGKGRKKRSIRKMASKKEIVVSAARPEPRKGANWDPGVVTVETATHSIVIRSKMA